MRGNATGHSGPVASRIITRHASGQIEDIFKSMLFKETCPKLDR